MENLVSRQAVKDWLERWRGYLDDDMITRMQIGTKDILAENEKNCSGEERKIETAKELLENMDTILGEMGIEVAMISDAVYGSGKNVETESTLTNEPRITPPMVVMMRDQRDNAEYLLKEIIKIRGALW